MPLKHVVKSLLARARGVHCQLCGHRDLAFRPQNGRPNAKCASCGSLERHRLLWALLATRLDEEGRLGTVLHFAPEPFLAAHLRRLSRRYVSTDLDQGLIDVAADITRLPFVDDSVDAIICSHVLEHIPDDAAAMSELRRVLSPGGWMVADVPLNHASDDTLEDPDADERTRIEIYRQIDHVRLYGPSDYVRRLTAAGFEVSRFTGAEIAGRKARRRGVPPSAVTHLCTSAGSRR